MAIVMMPAPMAAIVAMRAAHVRRGRRACDPANDGAAQSLTGRGTAATLSAAKAIVTVHIDMLRFFALS
jgi:hypothetical protein